MMHPRGRWASGGGRWGLRQRVVILYVSVCVSVCACVTGHEGEKKDTERGEGGLGDDVWQGRRGGAGQTNLVAHNRSNKRAKHTKWTPVNHTRPTMVKRTRGMRRGDGRQGWGPRPLPRRESAPA